MRELHLPIDPGQRELIDFVLYFRSVEGFVAEYEKNYQKLSSTARKKRCLKAAAYEMTEQYYCKMFNIGRRYADIEVFLVAKSKLERRINGRQN